MRFERLEYKHLSQMAEIEREAFDMPWTENMFIPEVENPSAYYIVGVRGEEVVCYGGFHSVLDEAHVTNIAVKSTDRGKGIGKFLMSELISRAKLKGASVMMLEVRDGNVPAIKLYEGFGFRVVGVRKKYYNNLHDALIMTLDLNEDANGGV
ncbi:MAG: ribosomal protein S18-alanine N-acetyltransferase [Clostridia bacterium]|nr:ribosomal protein S18-alanine N-acetyltransferase [Clostridia bacterium]